MNNNLCPCGSMAPFAKCCGLVFTNSAKNPEELMRSRYTAFVKGNVDYLLATSHENLLEEGFRQELEEACAKNKWLSLKIIKSSMSRDDRGYVEFVAYCRQGKSVAELHEKSLFLRVEGKWLYHSGEVLPHYALGGDELCWCGNGKKLKDCCLV